MSVRHLPLLALLVTACADIGPAAVDAVTLVPREVVRFGSRDAPGASLTSVVDVVATEDAVFVLEAQPPRVVAFGSDGVWSRSFGTQGDGPGELRQPVALGLLDGLLWVADPPGARLEWFDREGRSVRSVRWTVPADAAGTAAVPYAPLAGDAVLGGPAGLPVGAVFTGAVDHRSWVRVEDGGGRVTPLYAEELVATDFGSADVSGRQAVVLHPHRRSPLVRARADGAGVLVVHRPVAESRPDSFAVQLIGADGTAETDWWVSYPPTPADGWRERFRSEMADRMRAGSGVVDRTLLDALDDALVDIAYLPPVTEAVAGVDGSIWLRREDAGADEARWQVYDTEGRLVARAVLPRRWTVLQASIEELWVEELDDLDVPFVVRLRLDPAPGRPEDR